MMSLSEEKQFQVIEAFSSTSRYSDDLLNIDNKYLDGLISLIYPSELQLNKANFSDTGSVSGFAFVYFRWDFFKQNF